MNLKQLQAFLVISREHQITAAAKLLYTSQPPLSYQMKQLEKELNTTLFKRTAHGIELTHAGETFKQYAQQIVTTAAGAVDALNQEQAGTSGTLKIGMISSAGECILNSKLSELTKFYPNVKFEITEGNSFELLQQMNSGNLDLAFVRSPISLVGLNHHLLLTEPLVATYHQTEYSLPTTELTIQDLHKLPLIIYRRFEAMINESFAHHGIEPWYALKCDDARTAVLTADAGLGVAIVPASIAELYGHHSTAPIKGNEWQTAVQLVWPQSTALSPLAERCLQILTTP